MRLVILATMAAVVVLIQPVQGGELGQPTLAPPINHDATTKVEARQYVVQCQLITDQGTTDEKVISAPHLVVNAGQSATAISQTVSPFVTGVRKNREGALDPIITNLKPGIELAVLVTSLDAERVQIDATIKHQQIDEVASFEIPAGEGNDDTATLQAPEMAIYARRLVRTVKLGETVFLRCGSANGRSGVTAELTINEVDSNEPAITPIAATESDTAPDEAGPMYLVVYSVGDLLEPHAIAKQDADLEDVDFVPIIDTVLREALTEWSDEATIRPLPAKRAILVSQTQKGHEEIASTLRDQRDHVADVHKLLRR